MKTERQQLRRAGLYCLLWGTACLRFWGEGSLLMGGVAFSFAGLFLVASLNLRLFRPA